MTQASVRDLKANLSEYLRQVERGKTITITKRGKPIGRIVPEGVPLEERMQALVAAGLVTWSGRELPVRKLVAINRGPKMISDLVTEHNTGQTRRFGLRTSPTPSPSLSSTATNRMVG